METFVGSSNVVVHQSDHAKRGLLRPRPPTSTRTISRAFWDSHQVFTLVDSNRDEIAVRICPYKQILRLICSHEANTARNIYP